MKPQTPFNFLIPVNDVVLTSSNLKAVHVGDIEVDGVAYSETEFDYNRITWSEVDLVSLIHNIEGDLLEYVKAATLNHIKDLFTNKNAA